LDASTIIKGRRGDAAGASVQCMPVRVVDTRLLVKMQ
jgi:hypothetical protein